MEKLRLLRSQVIQQLSATVRDNLDNYRAGNFENLAADPANYIEIDQSYDESKLTQVDGDAANHKEVECCVHIYEAMGQMPPYLARDPRLWVYLTHTSLLEYARKRWPIPKEDEAAVSHISKHFFAVGTRGIERDNAASRLWWMASLCSRVNSLPLTEALTTFLFQYDVRANIIERPTTSQSAPILSAIINKLNESFKGSQDLFQRRRFRAGMKELNLRGGVKLLEALDDDEVGAIVGDCLK